MNRFLLNIDELVALVRAKALLANEGQTECVDALNRMLNQSALDVSADPWAMGELVD